MKDNLEMRSRPALAVVVLTLLFLPTLSCSSSKTSEPNDEFVVALYNGDGVWAESVTAMTKMFEWMGFTVKLVGAQNINEGSLKSFQLLAVPGGDMFQYAGDISESGKEKIREFIDQGHGYIGICGGAYFAAKQTRWRGSQLPYSPLSIFDGASAGPNNDIVAYPEYGMCRLVMSDTLFPPDSGATRDEWMLYYWGPVLRPNEGAEVAVLGRYAVNNEAAIVAFVYGKGRVFLIGTHPEIEEDSARDSVDFGDELDDRGTDWEFMKRATRWCLQP